MAPRRLGDLRQRLYRFVWLTDPPRRTAGPFAPSPDELPLAVGRPELAPRPAPRPSEPLVRLRPAADAMRVDVPTRHADAFLAALRAAGWQVEDTGETVTTEEGEDDLTIVRIALPPPTAAAPVAAPALAGAVVPGEDPAEAPKPFVRGAIYGSGDLVIGDGLQLEGPIMAEGSLTIGRETTVLGSVAAGRDLVLEDGAVTGDAFAGGRVIASPTARCSSLVARRGAAEDDRRFR